MEPVNDSSPTSERTRRTLRGSPDGNRIAFSGHGGVVVVNANGTNRRQLTEDHGRSPQWEPAGTRITYTRYFDGERQLMVIDADGTNQQQLRDIPQWSPSGTRSAYIRHPNNVAVIHLSDGEQTRTFTLKYHPSTLPIWAPDGSALVYSSRGIFLIVPDGSDLRQLTRNGHALAWLPLGK